MEVDVSTFFGCYSYTTGLFLRGLAKSVLNVPVSLACAVKNVALGPEWQRERSSPGAKAASAANRGETMWGAPGPQRPRPPGCRLSGSRGSVLSRKVMLFTREAGSPAIE